MTRAYDIVVCAVIWIIAVIVHLMSVELFAPGTELYELATTGTQVMNGQARADLWFEILAVYVPLLSMAGISVWVMVREYRRSVATATVPNRPPP